MLTIDGSRGEGGGQILRTSLGLSLLTGTPFRIEKIRASRARPGLLRQHLTAVNAAAEVGDADVSGAELGSRELVFRPRRVCPGAYRFAVGTAGSATLVLQTVLPALVVADAPSRLRLEGGTHNPLAPPFDFLERAFLPLLARMGPRFETELVRPGFFPAGGGAARVAIHPAPLEPLDLRDRGSLRGVRARALVANLPVSIAERELAAIGASLGLAETHLAAETLEHSRGPGNVAFVEVESERVTEVFSGFGARGVPAEAVGAGVARDAARYLGAGVAVGEHLADQLLIPLALARGGAFTTGELSAHATTNVDTIARFLDARFAVVSDGDGVRRVEVTA